MAWSACCVPQDSPKLAVVLPAQIRKRLSARLHPVLPGLGLGVGHSWVQGGAAIPRMEGQGMMAKRAPGSIFPVVLISEL